MTHEQALEAAQSIEKHWYPTVDEVGAVVRAYLEARAEGEVCECGQAEKGEHVTLGTAYAALLLADFKVDA